MNVPIDPRQGTSSIVLHRPQAVGTRVRQQGVYKKHERTTALSSGYVVHQQIDDLQVTYDVGKTLMDVDLDGTPSRVRYEVGVLNYTDQDLPTEMLGQGGIVRLHGPNASQYSSSSGEVFDLLRSGAALKINMVKGELPPAERAAITDPLGAGYEVWFEEALAHMFGPKAPKRVGDEWNIDPKLAADFMDTMADLIEPSLVTGTVTFVGIERINDVNVQRVEAWIKGKGKMRNEITYKIFANNNDVDVKYSALFPVELGLPPVEQKWSVKAKGHLVAEINDQVGDVEFDNGYEHLTRVVEVRR
jgi:hypothetical protein